MDPAHAEVGKIADVEPAPVAYVVFNRPSHTRRSFDAIRARRPSRLFIVADGPRPGRPDDIENCRKVREIVSQIDWPCEVERDFSEANLGCGRRVSSGLSWVFSRVERAVILEDDCLASPEFFSFCEQMLERYADNASVWVVSGNSYQPQFSRGDGSYYFSKYPDTWGWATWRRAWERFEYDMPFLDVWRRSPRWRVSFPERSEGRYFERAFHQAISDRIDTWDYQWTGCVIHGGGLCATPNANLVKNIGFDEEGTHTLSGSSSFSYELTGFEGMTHPSSIRADPSADAFHRKLFGLERGLIRGFVDRLAPLLPQTVRSIRRR